MTEKHGSSPESIIREIKRQTRRKFTAEEKMLISRATTSRISSLCCARNAWTRFFSAVIALT